MKATLKQLLEGQFGIEKESLRVNQQGIIVSSKHPFIKKYSHRFIKIDFAEQQIELITKIHPSIQKAVKEIELLTAIAYRKLPENEYLWNYSMPLKPINNATIPLEINQETQYRKYLAQKTGVKKQLISGIHFNWSLSPNIAKQMDNQTINNFYFKIFKKYQKASYIITKLFGSSPTKNFQEFDEISWRQNKNGYRNLEFEKSLENIKTYNEYRKLINQWIKDQKIRDWREVYNFIRTKPFNAERIEWMEIRNFDLNYLDPYGLNLNAFDFTHKFLIFLGLNQVEYSEKWLLKNFLKWLEDAKIEHQSIKKIITNFLSAEKIIKPNIEKIINQQKKLKGQLKDLTIPQLKKWELSTQILIEQAYLQNYQVDLIDAKNNLIKINGITIKNATLTPFDSKNGLEIINSKIKSNIFLKENQVLTTEQIIIDKSSDTKEIYQNFRNQQIVIKPPKTNFGLGITIFNFPFTYQELKNALAFAFSYDQEIIIEKFVLGNEYRILVINQQFVGALKRLPANVIGDGFTTIKQLITNKNKHFLRGTNYQRPLEKIKITQTIIDFLKNQNLTLDSIVAKGKRIFLLQNSNISTGGDSIDVSDQINIHYKKLVEKITRKLNLEVCGFDFIIPNLKKFNNYALLEMNWNPAIHIHTYPLIGKNRHPAKFILKMIDKFEKS